FLYGEKRFKEDVEFKAVSLSKIFLGCINCLKNKIYYKRKLQMIRLMRKLRKKDCLIVVKLIFW
ncbi:MAG: hypothetical protein ABIL89_03730, partial [candidate division WOR-3 bacterium]